MLCALSLPPRWWDLEATRQSGAQAEGSRSDKMHARDWAVSVETKRQAADKQRAWQELNQRLQSEEQYLRKVESEKQRTRMGEWMEVQKARLDAEAKRQRDERSVARSQAKLLRSDAQRRAEEGKAEQARQKEAIRLVSLYALLAVPRPH